jgi:hypothetical protein
VEWPARVFVGAKWPTLKVEVYSIMIDAFLSLQCEISVILCPVHGPVSKAERCGIVVPCCSIVGNAIDDLIMNFRMVEADEDKLGQVTGANPYRQTTHVGWQIIGITNANQ